MALFFKKCINHFLGPIIFIIPTIALSMVTIEPRPIETTVSEDTRYIRKELNIRNRSSGRVHYSISSRENWIIVKPIRDSLRPNQTAAHHVRLNSRILHPGKHTGTIVIRCRNYPRSTEVDVVLNIAEDNTFSVEPFSLDKTLFPGESPEDIQLTISTESSRSMRYQLKTTSDWLRVYPSTGSVKNRRIQQHSVSIYTKNLSEGEHQAYILLVSPDAHEASQKIPVQIRIHEQAKSSQEPSLEIQKILTNL